MILPVLKVFKTTILHLFLLLTGKIIFGYTPGQRALNMPAWLKKVLTAISTNNKLLRMPTILSGALQKMLQVMYG